MAFGDDFNSILPKYLVEEDKGRLSSALKQFSPEEKGNDIDYSNFYKSFNYAYFMQSDLVKEIRMSKWNDDDRIFEKVYSESIIISNTCDISIDNKHAVNSKQCLFAPIIDFDEYIKDLICDGYDNDKLIQLVKSIKAQQVTNLFYLPFLNKSNKQYIVFLDKIFWFPTNELNTYVEEMDKNRITSLNHFGYYLFILKLSYHLCRLPEQCDRELKM